MKYSIHIISRIRSMMLIFGLCPLFLNLHLQAQQTTYNRKINISRGDTIIIAGLLYNTYLPKLNPNSFYYWFSSNEIHVNQGGYAGILLHGEYTEFDKSNNLICKGNLNYGTKVGEWRTWYPDGKIKQIQLYKAGMLNGKCTQYDLDGNMIFHGVYKNDSLIKDLLLYKKDREKSKGKITQATQDHDDEK